MMTSGDSSMSYKDPVTPRHLMMQINPDDCRRAASHLLTAFSWAESEEGLDYWGNVYATLWQLADKGDQVNALPSRRCHTPSS